MKTRLSAMMNGLGYTTYHLVAASKGSSTVHLLSQNEEGVTLCGRKMNGFTGLGFLSCKSCIRKLTNVFEATQTVTDDTMTKTQAARQYTQAELDLAWRRLGGFERGNGKHKGSKGRRILSHA